MNAAQRLAALASLPQINAIIPAQFARLDVVGLRRMFLLTHADPTSALASLREAGSDPVRVLAVVAPHAIPRAVERFDAHVAAERARREAQAVDYARGLSHAIARGVPLADLPTVQTETDEDGRRLSTRPAATPATRTRNPGDVVQLSDGRSATVLYLVAGAVVAQCADGAVVSL